MAAGEARVYTTGEQAEIRSRSALLSLPSDRLAALSIGVLSAVAAGVQFNDQLIGLTGDNAQYMLLGLALATGRPYANGEYPWGYPATVAPLLALFGPENAL